MTHGAAPERDLSNWNLFFERKLDLGPTLTTEEHRLSDALARCLLGFGKTADRLGEGLLRERSGLHGRSFQRARTGLVEKGLLVFESGGTGRGRRSLYALALGQEESPAPERDYQAESPAAESPAPERDYRPESPAESPAQSPAPERGRIENRELKAAARTRTRTRENDERGASRHAQNGLVTAGADPDARVTADRGAAEREQDMRALADESVAAVVAVLRSIAKPGYAEAKLRPARLAALLAEFPGIDHLREARSLVDWETFGAGEAQATADGVRRFRKWLSQVDTPAANGRSQADASPYKPMPEGYRV